MDKSRSRELGSDPGITLIGRSCRGFTLAFFTSLLLLAVAPFSYPQNSQATEYQLKAAFLFNFAKFVDWPDRSFSNPRSPFTICVIGQDPFGGAMDEYLAKTIGGRPVQLAHFPGGSALSEARHCQIAFVSASERIHFHDVIESLSGTTALLVGDADGFAASGGTIEFTLEDNHIRFAINPEAAARADLKLSSKLMALAKIVHDGAINGKS
jgi:hypothetical protein